ncbi:MAG: accessory gene regulator B family protein [Bacilli bacterium]
MSKQEENKKKRKKKNGIWFNNTESIEYYAQARAAKIEKIIENIIFYGITIPLQLIQTAGVFVIAYFNDAFAELSFFLIGFFFVRSFLGETFHLNSTITCTTFTWTIFYIITALIPSIYVSVLLCIVLGSMLAIYMNYIVVKEEEKCQED